MLIVPGYSFTDGLSEDGSALHLAQFLTSCLITGFALTHFDVDSHVVQPSASTPGSDQGEGSYWFDTTNGLFRVKNDTRWDSPHLGPGLTNSFGVTMPKGAIVVTPSAGNMVPCQTLAWPEHLGVLLATAINGSKMVIQGSGLVRMLCRGPMRYGDVLVQDTALAGHAIAATLLIGYTCATYGIDLGMCLSTLNTGVTGLITCLAWM
jgi:hypothetical protein